MRTLVDLPEKDLQELNELSKRRKVSRASLVRCAVERYLQEERSAGNDSLDRLFGVWKDRNVDGMEYQEQMRKEWNREY